MNQKLIQSSLTIKTLFVFTIAFCGFAPTAKAHEFWISSGQYWFSPYSTTYLSFNVGENFTAENWGGNRNKVQQLVQYLPDGKLVDLSSQLSLNNGDSVKLTELREGTQMVIYHSKNSFIQLSADSFAAYLKEDGLTEIEAYRAQHNETPLPGKELYQRSVKTVFQVGNFRNDLHTKPTTLPLDIVPEKSLYPVKQKQQISNSFTIYFKGEPLRNALVKLWQKDKGLTATYITNKKGQVNISIATTGQWMLSVVHMVRVENNKEADWQSYWGSITWGYKN